MLHETWTPTLPSKATHLPNWFLITSPTQWSSGVMPPGRPSPYFTLTHDWSSDM